MQSSANGAGKIRWPIHYSSHHIAALFTYRPSFTVFSAAMVSSLRLPLLLAAALLHSAASTPSLEDPILLHPTEDVTLLPTVVDGLPAASADAPRAVYVRQTGHVRLPLPTAHPITRLAFGSCNKPQASQAYWDRIASRRPDVFVWLGDIHYADRPVFLKWRIPASAEQVRDGYEAQLRSPEYARVIGAVPVEGVYDDHDFGMNDGDKTYNATARALSQQLLLDFLGEPASSPRRSQPGVYVTHEFGAAPRRLRLILLDVRTNKDPYGGDAQDFLGAEQWAWLEGVLAASTAEITVIGSGLQVVSRGDPWVAEMWYKLPQSQARLIALLA